MRKWLILLWLSVACVPKEQSAEQTGSTEVPEEREEWIVYEGVVRSEAGNDIKMELSLLQNSAGLESKYKTEEEYISSEDDRLLTNRQGRYSMLYGTGNEMVVSLYPGSGSSLGWEPGKGYSINPKLPTETVLTNAKIEKLAFRTGRNSSELVLLDENSNPVASDGRYTLKKRSILFTVEGFVTIEPGSADFFEFNTRENWILAHAGSYGEVVKKYNELVKERHEGIYTKAVAFYVDDIDSTGLEVKHLVIKRIISMKAHQDYSAE